MKSSARTGWTRVLGEYLAVWGLVSAITLIGHYWTVSRGYEIPSDPGPLHDPMFAVFEVIIPMACGALLVRYFANRSGLKHVIWREPEYVLPSDGGKAPTYAPPLDNADDLLLGSALSSEPDPAYQLEVTPRISRLWWLAGLLVILAAIIVVTMGFEASNLTLPGVMLGLVSAFCWAFTQEYLLRGLMVAEIRRITRGNMRPLLTSMALTIPWTIPMATTATTATDGVLLVVLAPILGFGAFALRRMFTTLWAAIAAQFIFLSVFFVFL